MELTLDGIEKMRFEKEAQELFENQSHMRIPEFADACFWLADSVCGSSLIVWFAEL